MARRHGLEKLNLVHGRPQGEIGGGTIEVERDDAKLGARRARELIDGGASCREVLNHLRRDLGRVGRDALRRHAMISGEDKNLDVLKARRAPPLPKTEPCNRLFKTPEASRRLGERSLAAGDLGGGVRVTAGKIKTGRAKIGN